MDPEAEVEVLCKGLGASPGAATGKVVLTAQEAAERGGAGEAVILVAKKTDPDDVEGLMRAQGVLTALGGMTRPAAGGARGMGQPGAPRWSGPEIGSRAWAVCGGGRGFG